MLWWSGVPIDDHLVQSQEEPAPLQLDAGRSLGQQEGTRHEDPLSSRHDSRANLTSSISSSSDIPPSSGLMATKRAALRAGTVCCLLHQRQTCSLFH